MNSVALFFNAITPFKSDLSLLRCSDTRTVLLINSTIYSQLKEEHKVFFEKIYVIDPITFETTLPIVVHYLKEVSRDQIKLVTNDEACILVVGKLIDYLGLKGEGEKVLIKFIDKIVMKNTLDAQGIRTPYHQKFNRDEYLTDKVHYITELEKKFNYPFVVKPIALYGSASFKKIHNRTEWFAYVEQIVHSDISFQIEEFIEGTLFHCDAIVQNKEIRFVSISEYLWPMALFKEGYPTGSIVLPEHDSRWNQLNVVHQQIIALLQPPEGVTHCELFLTQNNEVVFLEIAARPSGALVVSMIERMTGVNIELAHFMLRLQRPITIQTQRITEFSFFCYVPKKNGLVLSLELPKLNSELSIEWNVKPGDLIQMQPSGEYDILVKPSNIAATIILSNSCFDHLYQDFLTLKKAHLVHIQPENYSSS
ncbi:ATP-grasp domain-containing protein [Legionella quateirensis]|uniref:Phosphoribosylglycinamide synthetase ATP-grasp (A) domain protein n=1 Tax=Legionella quateirensis TaxID=45072 RepID=A0A378KVW1_9GAMM|nr:ATP-grasp domain-containing protein [Legionella quateirensis]KTD47721.1 phosphoribosylglycinamide synthetase ATP-grasp (A) domain protein [Legionella quateirensis]STY18516.1 phosphoribosylglycinamide synthetase ATP-grasp (A) domain protein [Legionella quateirensis]